VVLQIETVLAYLKDDLGLEDEDIQKVVKKFPEVVNLDVELRLKANIAHMQKVLLAPFWPGHISLQGWNTVEQANVRP